MKNKLKHTLNNLDSKKTGIIAFDKFQIELLELGIKISVNDIENLILLYEEKSMFKEETQMQYINYNKAISNLIPVLTKNSDKIGGSNFKIGWSIS